MNRGEEGEVNYYSTHNQGHYQPQQQPSSPGDEYVTLSPGRGRGRRVAPPIWLPPPPPLSSDEEEDEHYDHNDHMSNDHHPHQYFNPPESEPPSARWGRGNFTPEEIHALDFPLKRGSSNNSPPTPPTRATPLSRIVHVLLPLLPALCFTGSALLINGIKTDSALFGAIFSSFQGVFWPSLLLLGIDLVRGRVTTTPTHGWSHTLLWLGGHSVLSSISMMCLLLSLQRLNISVSLSLSFTSCIFVTLLGHINRVKRFSPELITFAILGYFGFILVGVPAMAAGRGTNAQRLTAGIIGSLIASTTAVPATFILRKLRSSHSSEGGVFVYDSLIATSFAFSGSSMSLLIKVLFLDSSQLQFDLDPGVAVGLTTLVICGTVLLLVGKGLSDQTGCVVQELAISSSNQSKEEESQRSEGQRRAAGAGNCNILKLRLLIFAISCAWELIRQGIWTTHPNPYEIFGSVLVFVAFLLSSGYEAWSLSGEEEELKGTGSSTPFQFISWLLSKGISKSKPKPDRQIVKN